MSTETVGYIIARTNQDGSLTEDWDAAVHRTLEDGQIELASALRRCPEFAWALYSLTPAPAGSAS